MVAELAAKPLNDLTNATNSQNRVLHELIRRHGTSQTFGENLIFMLNRAGKHNMYLSWIHLNQISGRTPEDLVMQLLVLKMLYILFNTKGVSEYFYTNDLCVLVDVFLREIVDLDEESESVRYSLLGTKVLSTDICFSSGIHIFVCFTRFSPKRNCALYHINAPTSFAHSSPWLLIKISVKSVQQRNALSTDVLVASGVSNTVRPTMLYGYPQSL